MTNLVEVSDAGHVRTIRLNRPEKKNALSQHLAWGIVAAVDEAARDDNVWVVALTGSGDAFCAGVLIGLHEGWELKRCLEAGVCVAAASLSTPTCTDGVKRLKTVLELPRKYRYRAPLEAGD